MGERPVEGYWSSPPKLQSVVKEQAARIAELEGALRPFANYAQPMNRKFPDGYEFVSCKNDKLGIQLVLTIGDFRNAAKVRGKQ